MPPPPDAEVLPSTMVFRNFTWLEPNTPPPPFELAVAPSVILLLMVE